MPGCASRQWEGGNPLLGAGKKKRGRGAGHAAGFPPGQALAPVPFIIPHEVGLANLTKTYKWDQLKRHTFGFNSKVNIFLVANAWL